ncbi:ribbon-helix-helix domain-containing protein [Sphaerisporangium aureirubrum]|uniref:Ribbon-helix-helix domain-containing protein n=1 Tax=Sphaerisporangium aureirubrum TaxID=1544736 RepID=A0ABW1NEU2_9ACTN
MKLSVSLPEEDVDFLDGAVARGDAPSRSAALHVAIELLRSASLEDDYAASFADWESGGDAAMWKATTADGLADAAR